MIARVAGWPPFLLALADAMLGGEPADERPPAPVYDIRTGRPQVRRVVDRLGDEVERDVFPSDAA